MRSIMSEPEARGPEEHDGFIPGGIGLPDGVELERRVPSDET
jgi:hypothetical protein